MIPTQSGKKCTFYYKRHKGTESNPFEQKNINIYNLLHDNKKEEVENKSEYPRDRTLEVITFGDKQQLESAKQLFRKLGKIRKYVTGEGEYKGRIIYYAMIVFKFEFDLVKAFKEEHMHDLVKS